MKKIDFIASVDGVIVKYNPMVHAVREIPTPTTLTRHQKATLCFKALRFASSLLQEVGFSRVTDCGHSGFCIEMDGFILEMMVKEPPNIAYITSYPGYVYDPDKVTAKVERLVFIEGKDYVIQVTASYPHIGTCPPTFVVVRPDSPNVLKEAFMSILTTARYLISKDKKLMDKIQAVLAKRNLNRDYDRLEAQDDAALL